MSDATAARLWGWEHAFDHPVTVWLTAVVGGALALASLAILVLARTGRIGPALRRELWQRTGSWLVLAPALWLPILAGAGWTMLALLAVALWCYREYARATGLFREKLVSAVTVLAILFVYFAALDHWYGFFVALMPLGVVAIAAVSIPLDRPQGYIQRTGLAVFGLLLFGAALGHLAYAANDWHYRPLLLLVLVAVSLNDVFAFTVGKIVGGPKLLPATSPNKTVSGSLGALLLTTAFVALLAGPVFAGTALAGPLHRIGLGLLVGALGQLGDLMLSSIKRDIGIKDMGTAIPGHGGLLDRFNSLLLVAPAVFHYVGYFRGFGLDQPTRIITGG
jgi:phosphatidate cytidylyltransferase